MGIVAGWIVLICSIVLLVWGMGRALSEQRRRTKHILENEKETAENDEEPPLTEKHVTVMDKIGVSEVVGVRYPNHRDVYQLVVRYDNGALDTLTVDEMIFDAVPLHSCGTLAFVGDRVFGYCED